MTHFFLQGEVLIPEDVTSAVFFVLSAPPRMEVCAHYNI